ncbi:hypothetical protein ILUMI_03754 [Ignelater luminosus]|uniref:Uncharacterized protein n=1 Tax=Ignelater luminosus TaxID=2038154 RepID=A0A8K0GK66_IGNLU|nr:hypothetical protein ILUMI_03754 [Ignelater luminosus]
MRLNKKKERALREYKKGKAVIKIEDVENAIEKIKPGGFFEIDQITPEMVKYSERTEAIALEQIFNKSLKEGKAPVRSSVNTPLAELYSGCKKETFPTAKICYWKYVRYLVDTMMAQEHDVTVLCLGPYQCELSPIELIWTTIKGNIARYDTNFKLNDVKRFLVAAVNNGTGDD